MSNFPLSYKLSWLPRFLRPSLAGDPTGFAPGSGRLASAAPSRTVRLAFIGDISAVANRRVPVVDGAIASLLADADLVVGNCESPVVERPSAPVATRLGLSHAMTPAFLADALAAAGIEPRRLLLSLANNHALDQGVAGFEETVAALDRLGIQAIGRVGQDVVKIEAGKAALHDASGPAGSSVDQSAPPPLTPPHKGEGDLAGGSSPSPLWGGVRGGGAVPWENDTTDALTIGFAAFTLWRNAGAEAFADRVAMEGGAEHRPDKAGCDLLCAVPHWDWEFRHFPKDETRDLARKLAWQGAGLIVGHHAHVVQPVDLIGDTPVAYGLGDFLGTAFAWQPWPGRIGAILTVDVGVDGESRGHVTAYTMNFFFRRRDGDHERLLPVGAVEPRLRQKVETRLATIYGLR